MKKCPTCNKTFDDNLRFCQADGTPLVDDAPPPDPYATMVGNQADFQIPPKEESSESKTEPPKEVEEAPEEEKIDLQAGSDECDVLEVPEAPKAPEVPEVPEAPVSDDFDPLKTVIAGKDTASSVKVDVPKTEPKDPIPPAPPPSPEPPKFDAPNVEPPEMTGGLETPDAQNEKIEEADTPPPSPFDSPDDSDESASAPIPSPFDESMPPGYAPPSTPPFDPSEPVRAEKVGSVGPTVEEPVPAPIQESGEDWVAPPAPVEQWKEKALEQNASFDAPTAGNVGQNQTLAFVSIGTGILSMLCCFSIITGPIAIFTGYIQKGKISENPNEYGGGTLALIGMITGVVGILLFIALVILQIFSGALANLF